MIHNLFNLFATACTPHSYFLGFPRWYEYIGQQRGGQCVPALNGLNDVWLIVAAIIEILLRIAALAAVAMVIYGGVSFIVSEGDPNKAAQARTTVIDALIGLAIAVSAATIVAFIARSIK